VEDLLMRLFLWTLFIFGISLQAVIGTIETPNQASVRSSVMILRSDRADQSRLYLASLDSNIVYPITPEINHAYWKVLNPPLSPDQRWLIYREGVTVYSLRTDGRVKHKILTGRGYYSGMFIQWSPDYQWIIYEDGQTLYRIRSDGNTVRQFIPSLPCPITPTPRVTSLP
jgi:Tol biopolymer transport system component